MEKESGQEMKKYFTVQPFFKDASEFNKRLYYMVSSVSEQDEPNFAL